MITKEKFVKNMNYLYFLVILVYDDRSNEITGILKLLQQNFPKDENRFCEIEHYIFDNNFGKPTPESEHESVENFYERLIKNKSDVNDKDVGTYTK